jgi:hypothetical protein
LLATEPPNYAASSRNYSYNNNDMVAAADPALLQRMEMLEAKLDSILLKLDLWKTKNEL